MHVLVIGGTRFVGRHIVDAALGAGHEVTLFHRGQSGDSLFEGQVKRILGDRNTDLGRLAGRTWDAAIDTCAYRPREAASLAQALRGAVGHLVFISTISVYHDPKPGATEDAPLCPVPETISDEVTGDTYGYLKVLCEQEVQAGFSGMKTVLRPGLVVGPWDPTDRFTYWPAQFAGEGPVLVPEDRGGKFQAIDARDLGAFAVRTIEQGIGGTFTVTAPTGGERFQRLLDACRAASPADVIPLSPERQEEFGIRNWLDWPVFHGHERSGWSELDASRAENAGLQARPLEDTVADTLAWFRSQRPEEPLKAGLPEARRREIVAALGQGSA